MNTEQLAPAIKAVRHLFPTLSNYAAIHYLINHENFPLSQTEQDAVEQMKQTMLLTQLKTQAEEIIKRYAHIRQIMSST